MIKLKLLRSVNAPLVFSLVFLASGFPAVQSWIGVQSGHLKWSFMKLLSYREKLSDLCWFNFFWRTAQKKHWNITTAKAVMNLLHVHFKQLIFKNDLKGYLWFYGSNCKRLQYLCSKKKSWVERSFNPGLNSRCMTVCWLNVCCCCF